MYSRKAINQYQHNNAAAVVDASPHKVITLLMQGALDRMAQAKGFIQNQQLEGRNNAINKTADIIDYLRHSLSHDHNSELSANLDSLYDYMLRRLFEANLNNSCEPVDEVAQLLGSVYSSWVKIGEQNTNTGSDLAYHQESPQAQLVK